MTIYETIMATYPDLPQEDFANGTIILQDDSDGEGCYIEKWAYSEPLPPGLKVGK